MSSSHQEKRSSSTSTSSCMNFFLPASTTGEGEQNKVEESDDDMFTVPDVETHLPQPSDSNNNNNIGPNANANANANSKRRRGRNPADREYRRLKRLLRNRVSAQQARERKKIYVNDLESKASELHDKNAKLEEKISTLVNENTMLRKVLMNTRPKVDESGDQKHDH